MVLQPLNENETLEPATTEHRASFSLLVTLKSCTIVNVNGLPRKFSVTMIHFQIHLQNFCMLPEFYYSNFKDVCEFLSSVLKNR